MAKTSGSKASKGKKKPRTKKMQFNAVQLDLTAEQKEALTKAFGPDFVKKLQGVLVSNVSGRLVILGVGN